MENWLKYLLCFIIGWIFAQKINEGFGVGASNPTPTPTPTSSCIDFSEVNTHKKCVDWAKCHMKKENDYTSSMVILNKCNKFCNPLPPATSEKFKQCINMMKRGAMVSTDIQNNCEKALTALGISFDDPNFEYKGGSLLNKNDGDKDANCKKFAKYKKCINIINTGVPAEFEDENNSQINNDEKKEKNIYKTCKNFIDHLDSQYGKASSGGGN